MNLNLNDLNYFDYGAITLILLWSIVGFLRGLTKEISSLVVLAVTLLASPHLTPIASDVLVNNTRLSEAQVSGPISMVVAVLVLVVCSSLFMSLLSHIVDYGFIGKIDRAGGFFAGLLKSLTILIVLILVSHALTSDFLTKHILKESVLGRWGNTTLPPLYNAMADRFDHIPSLTPPTETMDADQTSDATPSE